MNHKLHQTILIACLLSLLFMVPAGSAQTQVQPYRVVGYYTYYSIYDLEYFVTDIQADLLTHLIYAHVDISERGQCESADEWADTGFEYPDDTPNQRMKGNFNQLGIINEANPGLMVMMSIGGWEHSAQFTTVAATQEARERFVRSCIIFMRNNGFEGIDLDWRYPVDGGQFRGTEADAANYAALVNEFRAQLDFRENADERRYALTVSVPPFPGLMQYYQLDEMVNAVDFFNLTTFGYEGSWSEITGHIAPLYVNSNDPRNAEAQARFTVDGAVNAMLDAGVESSKIVIGAPFYGQAWQSVEDNDFFGIFAQHSGVPDGTRDGGLLYYRDLATFQNSTSYTRFYDVEANAPWLYNAAARIAISYENTESIRAKATYVKRNDLGGMMAWELALDDAQQTLLRTIAFELNGIR